MKQSEVLYSDYLLSPKAVCRSKMSVTALRIEEVLRAVTDILKQGHGRRKRNGHRKTPVPVAFTFINFLQLNSIKLSAYTLMRSISHCHNSRH
jgi:hypothetical protein